MTAFVTPIVGAITSARGRQCGSGHVRVATSLRRPRVLRMEGEAIRTDAGTREEAKYAMDAKRLRAWEVLENGASAGQAEPAALAQACAVVCEQAQAAPSDSREEMDALVTPENGWRLAYTSSEVKPESMGTVSMQTVNREGSLAVGTAVSENQSRVFLLFVNMNQLRFGNKKHEHGSLGYYQGLLTEPVDDEQPVTSEDTVLRSLQLASIGGGAMAVLLLIFLLSNHLI
ncbi:hypothetical protein FVE85_5169 [Porphyridium purpureum]|uniref:Uncharacterized protein n=1 Tax=Porphyridium purpureum TaxID=35688 RepID=A0A5J4Z3T2_PORPP|nr:hypothetical protein FVE85_5169 [Porphyridium purpureum]|eukprot:POR9760..scf295_1